MAIELTLIGRNGCHLCDDARRVVQDVLTGFPDVRLTELSIDTDAALRHRYSNDIPVVLLDGRMHSFWRVDPMRLRSALSASPAATP